MLDTLGASAQPEEEWNKTFGGSGSDVGNSVIEAEDGGYIIAGWTDSFGMGQNDVWLTKTDSKGFEEWNRTYGGTGDDIGRSVMNVGDGYFIVGSTRSHGSEDFDLWLIKTDSEGNKVWDKTFGGPGDDLGNAIIGTKDGDYIIGGSKHQSDEDVDDWLIKIDSNGQEKWNRTLGDTGYETIIALQETDGEYVTAGQTNSYGSGNIDIWIVKTDSNGDELWNRTLGSPGSDICNSIKQTRDGGFILVGRTDYYGTGKPDLWLMKVDSNGNKLWDKVFGGPEWDEGTSIIETNDGYMIAGSTSSYIWLVKTDSSGDKTWDKRLAMSPSLSIPIASSIRQVKDGGYVILGAVNYLGEDKRITWDTILIRLK
mgnify:FL=1|jgi:hypothetical protein